MKTYGDRVPVRANEWDNRHFWRVSNAEHLEDVGALPGGNLPGAGPGHRRQADRRAGPALLHHQHRLRPDHRQNIALAYLPHAYAELGRELQIQYFADVYPVKVEAVGYKSQRDSQNVKPRW